MLYVVSYDLCDPQSGHDYDEIYGRIESSGAAMRVTDSFWIVDSKHRARAIADHIVMALDTDDKLFVGRLGTWSSSGIGRGITDWIKAHRG